MLLDVRTGPNRPTGLAVSPANVSDAYKVRAEVMRQLGGRDPQTAAMPAREVNASGTTLAGLPPDAAIEVETALVPGPDLPSGCTSGAALGAVAEVRLAFEIIGARYADRTAVAPLDAMADSFRSAGIVLGDIISDWRNALDRPLGMTLMRDGALVSAVEQCLPLDKTADFLWRLATHAAEQGLPLSAGTVIITGARIGPIPLPGVRLAEARPKTAWVRMALPDHAKN